ncbi:Atypical/PIKK/ATR protein kinase [Polytolypa hystricis UAMH7299]|uniref:Serine/threonine-protein kinase MEC1 n=1 Tax=Polytolypa hystricis (strain UAMH7299) TaxID=1447883 RepID=A0A2B7WRT6_POLH7|nr:Atypical/PIKK/ATR protein kinase [Polytolypa hystricis UAMH7299]
MERALKSHFFGVGSEVKGAEPTSSIIAAHLAPGEDRKHGITRDTFSQLKQEILGNGDTSQFSLDENIGDVTNLICVVLRAGLEPSSKAQAPGNTEEEVRDQVLDCLDIIQLALQRVPRVIYETSDPERVPLFALIIRDLVSLMLTWDQVVVQERICGVLAAICISQFKTLDSQDSSRSLSLFFQSCIKGQDLLCSLDIFDTTESKDMAPVALYFPSFSSHFLGSLDLLNLSRSISNIRVRLEQPIHAIKACFKILEAIACPQILGVAPGPVASRLRRSLGWVFDCLQELWSLVFALSEATHSAQREEELISLLVEFTTLLQRCYMYSSKLSQGLSLDQRALHVWLECGTDMLASANLRRCPDLQHTLGQLINEAIRLSHNSPGIGSFLEDSFLQPFFDLRKNDTVFRTLHQSFQHAIIRLLNKEYSVPKHVPASKLQLPTGRNVSRSAHPSASMLQEDSRLNDGETLSSGRARKRLRLSRDEETDLDSNLLETVTSTVFDAFGSYPVNGIDGLGKLAVSTFPKLSQDDQCEVLAKLGRMACAGANSLARERPINTSAAIFQCSVCDRLSISTLGARWASPQFNELWEAVTEIVPNLQGSVELRVSAMFSVHNILMHDPTNEHVRLGSSPLGDWCLQSLRSSVREVRIAASQTIAAFLLKNLDSDIRRRNFVIILNYLQKIIGKNDMPVQETSVFALCRIAEASGDEEMNIILLRLFECLGHANPFISATAYTGLSKLAQHMGLTPGALFRPFWRTLSVMVVKNIHNRPQMAEQLCDLLGMEVDNFLRLTEVHVLPHLVLMRKREIIVRIGATYDEPQAPFKLCTRKNNLASILALLLTQQSTNHNVMVTSILNDLSPEFNVHDLAGWVRVEPILIACELLRGIGDSGIGKESDYYRALELLSSLTPRRVDQGGILPVNHDLVACFIEEHILGIITDFAHIVNDYQIRQPVTEKKRNLIAIGEMVKIAKGNISIALPQICSCLRSALDVEELCDQAFASWNIIITSLEGADIEPLIDQTLSIIVKNWNTFQTESRKKAYELLGFILTERRDILENTFETLPSVSSISIMAKYEQDICELKQHMDTRSLFKAFCRRCQNENLVVVEQALKELVPALSAYEEFIHRSVINEQPDSIVAHLTRSLLDCCVKFNPSSPIIMTLSARCLGLIGCFDPNRVESVKDKKDILVLTNFESADETFDFILFFLQHVLVDAFLSASNTRAQGFLAYAMQALFQLCNLDTAIIPRSQDMHLNDYYRRWLSLPELVRNTATPFLSSKYTVTIGAISTSCSYPLFKSKMSHPEWLRSFVLDMLQKGKGENISVIFSVSSRIIRSQDISIATFLLPFAALNVALCGEAGQREGLKTELLNILEHPLPEHDQQVRETVILCSESVFSILDYMSRWVQGKKKDYNSLIGTGAQSHRSKDPLVDSSSSGIKSVEQVLSWIPAEVISRRAVECRSFARALFHWEQYIRQQKVQVRDKDHGQLEPLYQRLQDIYTQIDEPDGIEGISAHLHVLNMDQQILEHRKAGRWGAAQSWYELQANRDPEDSDAQVNLLTCLKESSQYDGLLNKFENLKPTNASLPRILPLAVEASWATSKWDRLDKCLSIAADQGITDFSTSVGSALSCLHHEKLSSFNNTISELRSATAKGFTSNSVASLQSSHDSVLKLHALAEIELLGNTKPGTNRAAIFEILDRRLDILGGCIADKQYLLGLRRATMELSSAFDESDVASVWLQVARIARKANYTEQAFNAVLHSTQLNDKSATIEYARLLWKEGHHRKAIRALEGAIAANAFVSHDYVPSEDTFNSLAPDQQQRQNILTARAHLLLAKWMDRAGQTQSEVIIQRYRQAIKFHSRWEKAHYYLGRHYAKILDSEKAKPLGKEAQIYLSGEASKLVIDNFLRSLAYGNKYVFQTLPKILTLWLEHASTIDQPFDPKRGDNEKFQKHNMAQRKKSLDDMNTQLRKYIHRIPAAVLFTILPQIVARICHSNSAVYNILTGIVVKTATAFPQQALWTVLAMLKSSSKDRASRGMSCIQKITEAAKKLKTEPSVADMRNIINQGQKFSEELLRLCVARIEDKSSKVSLARNLNFNHKTAPCKLVIPLEVALIPSLPSNYDPGFLKTFRAFPRDLVTIESILDEALILSSLQKPRKISIRGSDGKVYSLLCKPKDDLRKDQRLMEFNGMINRFLKKDVESSKRRLYIKTYAVTPLNEECGLIEWVDNLRTLRELVIKLLKERGIVPNYNEIRHYLNEAYSETSKLPIFTQMILAKYPPVLHEWFVEMFPEPAAWFAARLRYTRSSAVMSMVGYSLGLGDRHGENILFEEGTGGILHVDFNCLFDKGLTFDKPELVPFRLTHNMIDAFGAYGYNGPFRKTCELALGLLRQNEDSLMTILETFLHDPTTDFIGKKKRTNPKVPDTPEGVLEFVRNKLRGLLPGESVPLSVGGHVDELILQATSTKNLAAMYIGWCAFF